MLVHTSTTEIDGGPQRTQRTSAGAGTPAEVSAPSPSQSKGRPKMQVKRSCTLPGNGPSGAESAFRGSAQAVAQAPFYNLGCLDDPADHVGRPVAELAGPIPLSRAELTAALSLTLGLTTDTSMSSRWTTLVGPWPFRS